MYGLLVGFLVESTSQQTQATTLGLSGRGFGHHGASWPPVLYRHQMLLCLWHFGTS